MAVRGWHLARSIAAVAVALVAFVQAGCRDAGGTARPPASLTVFYTCDTRGHIEPCGCASGMAGGISRRQTYLRENRPENFLLVDAGDVGAGPREWEILELEYILKGYRAMGYHAVNAGHREASIGLEQLRQLATQYDKFVSANLQDADGKLVFQPYRIVPLTESYKAGVIGVMDDQLDPGALGRGLTLAPPDNALSRYLPELKKQADFIVLLAFCDEPRMKALAEQFFEIDVIIGGKVKQPSGAPLVVNRSAIVYLTDKGKSVGRLDLTPPADGAEGRWSPVNDIVVLKESMARDERVAALVEEFKQALKERDFQPLRDDEEGLTAISAVRSKDANRYAGMHSCKKCHAQAQQIHDASRHAHAFQTLVEKDQQYNPRCLKCHTVGYMLSDGYMNEKLTPQFKDVSCEACHGRADYHVRVSFKEEVPVKKVVMKEIDCVTCHDPENSPEFEREKYWEKIKHGRDPKELWKPDYLRAIERDLERDAGGEATE